MWCYTYVGYGYNRKLCNTGLGQAGLLEPLQLDRSTWRLHEGFCIKSA